MIKKILLVIGIANFINCQVFSTEGMWLPILLQQLNEKEMQDMGMKITADDIYSVNHSSLKDAIVLFGRGCTAELVSSEGLILTNHHCGYGSIQSHSSVQEDYLTDGFWAMNRRDELSNPGLSVSFLVKMEDVTKQALNGVTENMNISTRDAIIESNCNEIAKEAIKNTHYKASVKPFYNGNQYYIFIYEVFTDVRLVGAPPSSIGKFGGDTDNWMWPRHTGDFCLFRIYADKSNNPANYSTDNVPYKPKKYLPISLKGVKKDDFTFVYGFPGRTTEYLTSFAVDMIYNSENPSNINIREKKLAILNKEMLASDTIRIQYSSKYAGIANYWKKWLGENAGLKKLNAIEKKKLIEKEFTKWANENPEGSKFKNLLPEFEIIQRNLIPINLAYETYSEAIFTIEIFSYAKKYFDLIKLCSEKTNKDEKKINEKVLQLTKGVEGFYKNFNWKTDKRVCTAMLTIFYKQMSVEYQPSISKIINKKFKRNIEDYANYVYSNSIFTSENKLKLFLKNFNSKNIKVLTKDPAILAIGSFNSKFEESVLPKYTFYNQKLDSLNRLYVEGLMKMQINKRFYPDANSTLRIAYGKVDDYYPKDGAKYNYFTTLSGMMEKELLGADDYVVPLKLKQLFLAKDYGQYSTDGEMRIAFTASNHTTGGNSGSPVLNANGELIGINFDRNWEGTMSDIMYDPNQCRNITLDIRYCLFIIDKYAGAKHLVDEMTLVK